MSRVLITGGSGFVGQWLARAALERGDYVVLAGFGSNATDFERAETLNTGEWNAVRWITADMRSPRHVDDLVETARPDIIFHLAGVAFPPQGEQDPTATYDVNTLGVVRLLSAVAARKRNGVLDPVTLVVGSALQYGIHAPTEMPLRESAEQRPLTVYAASKLAQEIAALQAARANGLRVICTRSFNHAGVGQPQEYLLPSLVRRVMEMKRAAGSAERSLALGNDAVRDYLHVQDVVAAYLALADRGHAGEVYNVSSGTGVRVTELASDILRRAGVEADARSDPSLARATDIPVLIGSAEKLTRDTGWVPRKTHADIIDDLLRFAHAETD